MGIPVFLSNGWIFMARAGLEQGSKIGALGATQSSDKSRGCFFIQPQILLSIITLPLPLSVNNLHFWSSKADACAWRDVRGPSPFCGRLLKLTCLALPCSGTALRGQRKPFKESWMLLRKTHQSQVTGAEGKGLCQQSRRQLSSGAVTASEAVPTAGP